MGFYFHHRHIHSWESSLLWPSRFTHSEAIGNSPLCFPSSILDTFRPGVLIFGVISFWPFIQFMQFSWQVYWGGLPFPPPGDHILSELSAMTRSSWVTLHSMAHSFIELYKPLCHQGSEPWRGYLNIQPPHILIKKKEDKLEMDTVDYLKGHIDFFTWLFSFKMKRKSPA